MNKRIFETPDPLSTPGITFHMPVVFNGGHLGQKVWRKLVKDGKMTYVFDAVYFEPQEILDGAEKRRLRYLFGMKPKKEGTIDL